MNVFRTTFQCVIAAVLLQEWGAQPVDMPLASALWDLNDTTKPETLLQPLSQITCLNYGARVRT